MNPCDHCAIDDKIYECCGRHPETGETVFLSCNQIRVACPHLNETGQCRIYEHRPFACRTHYCIKYQGVNEMAEGFRAMQGWFETIR